MRANTIILLRKQLLEWYKRNHRELPWRDTDNPYHIWVSEVMLQQTQVNTVIPYYHKFIKRFPSIKSLAESDMQDVLKVWEGLGYYARARNFHRAVRIVLKEYDGNIPRKIEAFQKLPGVGDYIASAVSSIAFRQPYAVVDGNVKRVLARVFLVESPVNGSDSHKAFKKNADQLLDPERPGIFNQAVMELGALVCRPKNPLCDHCPLEKICCAFRRGQVAEFPKKNPKKSIPLYYIAVGVVYKNDRVLITQRKPEGLLGGLWEFPGGKIKKGEGAHQACVREIKEEVNLVVDIESSVTRVKHAYTHFKIIMDVFRCNYLSGRVRRKGPVAHCWVQLKDLEKYPFPKANHKFIPYLKP